MAVKTRKKRDPKAHPAKKTPPPGVQKHGEQFEKHGKAFQAKNQDRKTFFTNSTDKQKYAARAMRRLVNGAFGRELKKETKNFMSIGTSGKLVD